MKRWLWVNLVPGELWMVAWWLIWAAIYLYCEDYGWSLIDCVFAALNLYSWSMQHRARAKS